MTELMDHLQNVIGNGTPEASQFKKELSKKPPEEQVKAARKAFYGIVHPAILNGEPLSEDDVAAVEAIFETCWENQVQQSSRARSGSGTSRS